MASMVSLSSPLFWSQCSQRSAPRFTPRRIDGVNSAWDGRTFLVLPVRCLSSGPSQDAESEAETTSSPSSSSSSPASTSTYKWCAALGGIGLIETAYLTYLKLTNSDAFCPVGGGTCGDILNSDYAVVFGMFCLLLELSWIDWHFSRERVQCKEFEAWSVRDGRLNSSWCTRVEVTQKNYFEWRGHFGVGLKVCLWVSNCKRCWLSRIDLVFCC